MQKFSTGVPNSWSQAVTAGLELYPAGKMLWKQLQIAEQMDWEDLELYRFRLVAG